MTTLRTAAANREGLLRYFYDANRSQATAARTPISSRAARRTSTPSSTRLQGQQVRVGELRRRSPCARPRSAAATAENHTFSAGTAVISTKQPLGRLAETLLEKSPTFSQGFLEEQQTKTHADEPDDFYDLTSWSMPLAMNVRLSSRACRYRRCEAVRAHRARPFRAATYGYVVDAMSRTSIASPAAPSARTSTSASPSTRSRSATRPTRAARSSS